MDLTRKRLERGEEPRVPQTHSLDDGSETAHPSNSDSSSAKRMWKAKIASHIRTASTTVARSQSQSKTKPRKLQY